MNQDQLVFSSLCLVSNPIKGNPAHDDINNIMSATKERAANREMKWRSSQRSEGLTT